MVDEKEEKKLVIVESPFKGVDWSETRRNVLYARLCVRDCLQRGEAPYASHLFFTQTGVLDDTIPEERMWGIHAGQVISQRADLSAVYKDFGISRGMEYGIKNAQEFHRPIVYRELKDTIDLERALQEIGNAQPFIDLGKLLF